MTSAPAPRKHTFGSSRRIYGEQIVRGDVRYLDDTPVPGCLHAFFLRSPHAHARILQMDVARAQSMPGVRLVLTPSDLGDEIGELVCRPSTALTGHAELLTLPLLPNDVVRYWGEPIALVVATSLEEAADAAETIAVDFDVLEPILDTAAALSTDARPQHPALPTNVLTSSRVATGAPRDAIDAAYGRVLGSVVLGRSSAVPLEPRGCVASWNRAENRLEMRVATQLPHAMRTEAARIFGMAEHDVHVVAPPLGGAFGFKFPGLPEELLTAFAARQLRSPVRWVESRSDALLIGAREYTMTYEAGYGKDGRVLGLIVALDADVGALAATPGPIMPTVAGLTFPGGYDVSAFEVTTRAVMTNKGPWNGARGFGKEATCIALESVMDAIARQERLDPVAVRRVNLLTSDRFPHRTPTMTLDSGDYHCALDMVLEVSGYEALRAHQRQAPQGTAIRTGVGVAFELSPEGLDAAGTLNRGYETATVRLDLSGHVTVLTGVTSPGTGSETAIAQAVAERLGVQPGSVRVVQGDTDRTPFGGGSFSSRAVLVGATAAWLAANDQREHLVQAAAHHLGAAVDDIEVGHGNFWVAGDTDRRITLRDLARATQALGGAVAGLAELALEVTRSYRPGNLQSVPDKTGRLQQYPTYAYSASVAHVEVDLETGQVAIKGLSMVHDCGTVINLDLVNAQVHGAIAMGVGMALTEEEIYDANGAPRARDFKRYMLPRVRDLPPLRLGHLESPSPFSMMGTKGAGETGVGGAAAAVINAIHDAVGRGDLTHVVTPLTPERVLDLVEQAHKELPR